MYASGDAVIGINPATDDINQLGSLVSMLDGIRQSINAPIQSCVLTHISNSIILAKRNIPVDLFFQSIGGTEGVNSSFGVSLEVLQETFELGKELNRGQNYMYFETGQGSALSANANHGVDQQTIEARAYAVAREYNPLLVNTVVGFIGLNIFIMASRLFVPGWRISFAVNYLAYRWAVMFVTPTMLMQIKMIWIIY